MADNAKKGDDRELNMLQAVYALVFFGVPSHGMAVESLRAMVCDQPNAPLVSMLDRDLQILASQHQSFCEAFPYRDSKVFSFYETKRSPTAVNVRLPARTSKTNCALTHL
jgi:hypothetical protein